MNEYSSDINFIDLKSQKDRIRLLLDAAIARVLDHGQFIMGPEVKELEFELVYVSNNLFKKLDLK